MVISLLFSRLHKWSGLFSKAAHDNASNDKFDESLSECNKCKRKFKIVTGDVVGSPKEARKNDLTTRLAAIETKINHQSVSTNSTTLHAPFPQDQWHIIRKTPFNIESPHFDGLDPLGCIFKINYFLFYPRGLMNLNRFFLFRWSNTKLVMDVQ